MNKRPFLLQGSHFNKLEIEECLSRAIAMYPNIVNDNDSTLFCANDMVSRSEILGFFLLFPGKEEGRVYQAWKPELRALIERSAAAALAE